MMSRICILFIAASLLVGLTVVPSASATSPYDDPYGIQWNHMAGSGKAMNPSDVVASPDGSAWLLLSSNTSIDPGPWGIPRGSPSRIAGIYAQISPHGAFLQGNELPFGLTSRSQDSSSGGIAMQGTTAAVGFQNQNGYWAGETPAQTAGWGRITFTQAPDGTVGRKINTATLGAYTRPYGTAISQTSDDMWFVGGRQAGDLFTLGDGVGGYDNAFDPYIGMGRADGTINGPAIQPQANGRSYFTDLQMNASETRAYASGVAGSLVVATPGTFDPDGAGPAAGHAFTPNLMGNRRGIAAVYDTTDPDGPGHLQASFAVLHSMVWESAYGYENIVDNCPTADGGVILVGYSKGHMPKVGGGTWTNPAVGTHDTYIAKYDSTGAMVWDYQAQTTHMDYAGGVQIDADGSILIGIYSNNGTDNDVSLMKLTSAGVPVWTQDYDGVGGTKDTFVGMASYSKEKVYTLAMQRDLVGSTPWPTADGYANKSTKDVLLQKMSPGDFDTDGYTDWDDLNDMIDALAGGPLVGDDTYDFDGDGDSRFLGDFKASGVPDDIHYFMKNIMDSDFGDFNWDGVKGDPGDYALLGGWMPGDAPISLPAGWRGFAGPDTPNLVDLEEWLYLNELSIEVIPEPAALLIWSLMAGLGIGAGWRRRTK